MPRLFLILLIVVQTVVLQSAPVFAATAPATRVDPAEAHRGFAAVGSRASAEPALRLERQAHEPSPSFMLGAALGAWISAAAILDYDLKTPSGDGGDDEVIGVACYDERVAFTRLETSRQAFGLTPSQMTAVVGLTDPGAPPILTARQQTGASPRCR